MLYPPGTFVYAACNINTPACGDHPAFHHASKGDRLYVVAHDPDRKGMNYTLSQKEDGSYPFSASGVELMGQAPFKHNDPALQGTTWRY